MLLLSSPSPHLTQAVPMSGSLLAMRVFMMWISRTPLLAQVHIFLTLSLKNDTLFNQSPLIPCYYLGMSHCHLTPR